MRYVFNIFLLENRKEFFTAIPAGCAVNLSVDFVKQSAHDEIYLIRIAPVQEKPKPFVLAVLVFGDLFYIFYISLDFKESLFLLLLVKPFYGSVEVVMVKAVAGSVVLPTPEITHNLRPLYCVVPNNSKYLFARGPFESAWVE